MSETGQLIIGMLKCQLHRATLTRAQKALLDSMESKMIYDSKKQQVTYIIPADADERDLKRVKYQIALASGGAVGWPVKYVNEGDAKQPVPRNKNAKP